MLSEALGIARVDLDMRAQIEQAARNVQACLAAGGAKASNITLTRAFVTDAAAFAKNADMLNRELGPVPAPSTVQESLAAGSDFLVEIEAVADLKSDATAKHR